jgi:hypothetical protein
VTTHAVLARRVNRGAALLDTIKPGWQNDVELLELDMSSACSCVLGQLFEDQSQPLKDDEGYTWGEEYGFQAGIRLHSGHKRDTQAATKWTIDHGFDYDRLGSGRCHEDYATMREFWQTEIEARLA